MNNFVKRSLSGFVFISLIISSILLNPYVFAAVFAVICGLAAHEFHKITNQQQDVDVNLWLAVGGAILLFISSFLYASGIYSYLIFSIYGVYFNAAVILELYRQKSNPIHNWAYFIVGQVFIAIPFSSLNFIQFIDGYQPILLLSVFVTIWINDTGAYLVGVTFGKHRLFERVSPKKSWEGFVGGAMAAMISGYIFSIIIPDISLIHWLICSEIIVLFGTYGDLIESLLKRTVHVKDSGTLIPGHGGMLDRFDSMLLAAPAVYIYLSLIFHQVNK